MQRISLLVIGTLAVASLALVDAQEATDKSPSHSVNFVLSGAGAERSGFKNTPLLIEDGIPTDVPIQTSIKVPQM